jgi:hypothetical protein
VKAILRRRLKLNGMGQSCKAKSAQILNIQDVLMEGPWGDSRMPEMLPVDYEPDEK